MVLEDKEKLAKIAEMRERLASRLGPEDDDSMLIRFAGARDWDVDAATSMVEAMLDWRRDYDVEAKVAEVENDPKFEFLKAYYPTKIVGETKSGHPLVVERIGRLDSKGILSKYTLDEMVQFHVWWCEKLAKTYRERSDAQGKVIDRVYVISDMVGLGWGHFYRPGLAVLQAFKKIDADYYPDTLLHLTVVNPPTVFGIIWKIVKVFMDAQTLDAIEIVTNNKKLPDAFNDAIDLDVLPEAFGGNSKVELPQGGAVGDHAAADHSQAQTVTVSTVHEVQRRADKGAKLLWDFSVAAHDIAFSLTAPDGKVLITERRLEPWQGKMEAPMAGDYTFKWTNESVMRKKSLTYIAQVSDADMEL